MCLEIFGELMRISHDGQSLGVVLVLDELHRHDGSQHQSELAANLGLLVGGIRVDDAVDGLCGLLVCRVENTRWPGLGGGDRRGHGLEVAHLADHDDVGVLAHAVPQRLLEGRRVGAHLALGDGGFVVAGRGTRSGPRWSPRGTGRALEMRLIIAARVVDFPEPVGPVISTSPPGKSVKVLITSGRLSSSTSLMSKGTRRKTAACVPRCMIDVAAETGDARDAVAQVDGLVLLELLLLGRREDGAQHLLDLLRLHGAALIGIRRPWMRSRGGRIGFR